MKKVFLLFVILNFATHAYSQFDKGRMLAGGSIGVEFSKTRSKNDGTTNDLYKSSSFTFEPQFAYFVANRFAIGAGLSITSTTIKTSFSNNTTRSQEVTINPMARYYLPNKLFFQAKFPLGGSSTKFDYGTDNSESHYAVAGMSLGVGYAIMLNSFVSIEPLIQFSSIGYNDKDSSSRVVDNSFNFRIGFQVYLGN